MLGSRIIAISYKKCYQIIAVLIVARERFELSSEAPEASMLDRYTTGLWHMV
jgi:hypothetical protein